MPEDFGTNFIPQRRVDPKKAGLKVYNTVDSFSVLAILLFFTVLFIALGIIGSGFFIDRQVASLENIILDLSSEFNEVEINELARLDSKVVAAASLIDTHTSVTSIQDFLEDHTQNFVQVKNYSFDETSEGDDKGRYLIIEGEALSYNTLANQQTIFENDEEITEVVFSEIKPTEVGTIAFRATLNLKNSAFSYNILSQ